MSEKEVSSAWTAEILNETVKAVSSAGEIVLEHWNKPKTIRHKGRIDLVTETDVAVEEHLKEKLTQVLPEADFLAEESAEELITGDLTWIIDPLDGTTNFAHGFPFVAISVALYNEGQVVAGVIYLPILGELFTASVAGGAFLNGSAITVSSQNDLESSLVATGFPYWKAERLDLLLGYLGKILTNCQGIRRTGAAAADLAYLACGRLDAFYELGLKPWDTAAGWLLVREAGGKVSCFDPLQEYNLSAANILASNGQLHESLSNLLNSTG